LFVTKRLLAKTKTSIAGSLCLQLVRAAAQGCKSMNFGNIISYEEYHPFGTTAYQATNGSVTAAAKRYRYTGMERDEETGLEYHKARYYISWLGRWMNCDPIGIGDGVNVYAYCRNNPVGNVDTGGTQTNPAAGLRAVGTGATVASSEGAKASTNMAELIKKTTEDATLKKTAENEQAKINSIFLPKKQTDFLYGPNDPQYWLMQSNYNPERAGLAATKKLADKESGAMKIFIWISYGLDKAGEYGSPIIALRPPGGTYKLPEREKNFKAPIETAGNGPIKPQTRPLDGYGSYSLPLRNGEFVKEPTKTSKEKDKAYFDRSIIDPKKISIDKQLEHVKGSKGYNNRISQSKEYPSYVLENPELLIKEFQQGGAQVISDVPGRSSVIVKFDRPIGVVVDQYTGKEIGKTYYGAIKYGKNLHITPVLNNQTP